MNICSNDMYEKVWNEIRNRIQNAKNKDHLFKRNGLKMLKRTSKSKSKRNKWKLFQTKRKKWMKRNSKSILGADISISSRQPVPDLTLQKLESELPKPWKSTRKINFNLWLTIPLSENIFWFFKEDKRKPLWRF